MIFTLHNTILAGIKNATDDWPEKFKFYTHNTANELFCSARAESTGNVANDTERLMSKLRGQYVHVSC